MNKHRIGQSPDRVNECGGSATGRTPAWRGFFAQAAVITILTTISGAVTAQSASIPSVGDTVESSAGIGKRAATAAPAFGWEDWWRFHSVRLLGDHRTDGVARANATVDFAASPEVGDVLLQALLDGTPEEKGAAALALARTGDPGVLMDIVMALEKNGRDTALAQQFVLAMGVLGSPDVRPYLRSLILDQRFGRGALGAPETPVPTDIRATAVIAYGLLPIRFKDDVIRNIVFAPYENSSAMHWAACLALGLRSNDTNEAIEAALSPDLASFGPPLTDNAFVKHELADYLRLVARRDVEARSRGALLVSLARLCPEEPTVFEAAAGAVIGTDLELSRSAVLAMASLRPAKRSLVTDALWARVQDSATHPSVAGLAAISIGARAEDEDFTRLVRLMQTSRTMRPFVAFGLVEAVRYRDERRSRATSVLREWIESPAAGGDDIGAACLALGLLHDEYSVAPLQKIADEHSSDVARSSAALGLGLLGHADTESFGNLVKASGARRAQSIHDGALALAFSPDSEACRDLCAALKRGRDGLSLSGIARAIGHLRDPRAVEPLMTTARDGGARPIVRAFAIGALGLLLESPDADRLVRLRERLTTPFIGPELDLVVTQL